MDFLAKQPRRSRWRCQNTLREFHLCSNLANSYRHFRWFPHLMTPPFRRWHHFDFPDCCSVVSTCVYCFFGVNLFEISLFPHSYRCRHSHREIHFLTPFYMCSALFAKKRFLGLGEMEKVFSTSLSRLSSLAMIALSSSLPSTFCSFCVRSWAPMCIMWTRLWSSHPIVDRFVKNKIFLVEACVLVTDGVVVNDVVADVEITVPIKQNMHNNTGKFRCCLCRNMYFLAPITMARISVEYHLHRLRLVCHTSYSFA